MTKKANFIEPDILVDRLDSNYYASRFYDVERKIVSSGYVYKEFKEICKVVKCGPFGSSVLAENYATDGIAMVRPLNLKEILLADDNLVRFPEKDLPSNSPMFHADDILFARVGMPSCSIVTKAIGTVTISPNIIAATIKDNVDKHYVTTFLNTNYGINQIERRFKAVSQPTISTEDVKTLKIVLPSSVVQQYIGNKIRKAEKLREEARGLREEANALLNEEFDIEIPRENQKYSWVETDLINGRIDGGYYSTKYKILEKLESMYNCISLGDIVENFKTGKTPTDDQNTEGGVPIIGVNNIMPNHMEVNKNTRRVSFSQSLTLTEIDDLLITRVGSVGICVVVEENEVGYGISDNVIIAKLKHNTPPSRFIGFYLNSFFGKLQVERVIKGAVQEVINYQSLNVLKIPILSKEVMESIDNRVQYYKRNVRLSNQLINEAKQDVEDLIEGKFDHSKLTEAV